MLTAPQFWPDGLGSVLARIERAVGEAGRPPGSVRLVAVSKQQPAAAVRRLAEAGQRDFGENYLQEALPKLDELADLPLCWHFIGQLQGNKTREVAERFQWAHTVDRERIAARLSAQRPHYAPPLEVPLQVKLADEAAKGGVAPADLPGLAEAVAGLPRLRLRGLMCIPAPADDPAEQRRPFARLRELLEALNRRGHALDTLSMGMSADLEAAVAEGATIVRVGTAVFGARA
jgi:hypothetical protein